MFYLLKEVMMFKYILLLTLFFSSSIFGDQLVKIGVLAKRSNDITISKYTATADYLSDKIEGYRFKIVPLGFEELRKSVQNNQIDFVLTNTMYYVELEHLYGISRIATLKNRNSKGVELTNFGGVIFTRDDSEIKNFQDLKGKRFGGVDINSFGGWVMAQKELLDNGIDKNDFSSFKFFGSHDAVVQAVKDGTIDAGTVRSDTLERMNKEGMIDLKNCKVLEPKFYKDFAFRVSTQLYPEWPFAKLSSTSRLLANKVLIALLEMPADSKAAIDSDVAGWTIPLDYTKVHTLLEELHLGPYKELGKFTFARFYELHKLLFYTILLGLFIIVGVLTYIYILNKKLKENQQYILSVNTGLEEKINERVSEINRMYLHEKYLKNILKTIADINELLITSFSTHSVIENSMLRLVKHDKYRYVWVSLLKSNVLEMSIHEKNDVKLVQKRRYSLQSGDGSSAFESVQNAIEQNKTIIKKLPIHYEFTIEQDTYECSSCWIISIPIIGDKNENMIGCLSVFLENEEGFEQQEIQILENLSVDIGLVLNSIQQKSRLELLELEKISNYEETILAFVNIIEQRDSYTAGHTIRVAEYCRIIAEAMNIEEKDIVKLEQAAILHDIGKVVTPDSILLKPGSLTLLEYELIKEHANIGYQMLSKIKMYKELAEIIKYHHSRYDGTGYPPTPKDNPDSINILSYIMTVADAFDAMTTNRIYKARKSIHEALEEIKLLSAKQFHPDVAAAAISALDKIEIVATSQMPKSELEQRRFAYFFLDSLTDIYNETYLQTVLIQEIDEQRCLYRVELSNFAEYNKKYGWRNGNLFLKELSEELRNKYVDAMLFRYHGDNFILLFEKHHEIHEEDITSFNLFKDTFVEIRLSHYDLKDAIPEFW